MINSQERKNLRRSILHTIRYYRRQWRENKTKPRLYYELMVDLEMQLKVYEHENKIRSY